MRIKTRGGASGSIGRIKASQEYSSIQSSNMKQYDEALSQANQNLSPLTKKDMKSASKHIKQNIILKPVIPPKKRDAS